MTILKSNIIPALQTLKILGNAKEFRTWLSKTHSLDVNESILQGYSFALACCVSRFIYGLEVDESLRIEDDFYFQRALANLIPLQEIKLTCTKARLIAGLKPFVRSLLKAKSIETVDEEHNKFEIGISLKFEQLYQRNVKANNGLDKQSAKYLSLLNFAHTYLMQIGNNGPYAYQRTTLSSQWLEKERLEYLLDGYKYAIQFLWFELLGREQFNRSSLKNLHTADSWREYTYVENDADDLSLLMSREFELEKQNSFDSYFYRIQEEITTPLEAQYGFPIYRIDECLDFENETFCQTSFVESITHFVSKGFQIKLDWDKQIRELLYWYSFELVEAEHNNLHFGVSSFNTMLAGTVSLFKPKESEMPKPVIAKFIHPQGNDGKNDYSYGILIDTKSSADHYSSGWVIYQNVCGDYSGFSNAERMTTEELIAKYLRKDKIELRELAIPLEKFKAFTKQYERDQEKRFLGEQYQKLQNNMQPLKAHLFELLTYHILHRNYGDKFLYKLNADKKSRLGEKDIVLENTEEVILIECKLNVQNYNVENVLDKLEKKIETYNQRQKSCQLWTWEPLSIQNKILLDKRGVKSISINDPVKDIVLRGIDLNRLLDLMSIK